MMQKKHIPCALHWFVVEEVSSRAEKATWGDNVWAERTPSLLCISLHCHHHRHHRHHHRHYHHCHHYHDHQVRWQCVSCAFHFIIISSSSFTSEFQQVVKWVEYVHCPKLTLSCTQKQANEKVCQHRLKFFCGTKCAPIDMQSKLGLFLIWSAFDVFNIIRGGVWGVKLCWWHWVSSQPPLAALLTVQDYYLNYFFVFECLGSMNNFQAIILSVLITSNARPTNCSRILFAGWTFSINISISIYFMWLQHKKNSQFS